MRHHPLDLRDRVRTARERLEALADRAGQLRARIEGGARPTDGRDVAPGPLPTVEVRQEPSREDGLFLGDDPWEIALVSEEGK
jgi:hypothetical protein